MIKIAVIGASYFQLPLINKLKEIGYESHCFAWDDDDSVCKNVADYFYPISIIEKELILTKCQQLKINAILSIASDLAVPTMSYVAKKMGLICNSFDSALVSTNKFLMRSRFQQSGLPTPFYQVVTSPISVDSTIDLTFPLIVKPTDRSGSRGVTISNSREELNLNIQRAISESFEKKAIIEAFIDGYEYSVESISQNSKHTILAITEKVTSGEPYFVELEHHQPAVLKKGLSNQIEEIVKKGLDALEIKNGASHSELKVNSKGIFLIEIGGRMGGDFIGSHLVQLSTGYDFMKNTVKVALGEPIEIFSKSVRLFSGVYFLSKLTQDLLPFFINPPKSDFGFIDVKLVSTNFEDLKDSSNRAGYLIYQSSSKLKLP